MSNDERESLRQIAYGPDATPQERAAAEKSLHELDERTLAAVSDAHDEAAPQVQQELEVTHANEESAEHIDSADTADEAVEPSLWARSIRVGWLIPVVAAGLLVGVLSALSTSSWLDAEGTTPNAGGSTSGPQDVVPEPHIFLGAPPVPGSGPGNVDGANTWFATPATAEDALSSWMEQALDSVGVDPGEVRLVGTENTSQHKLWVTRQGDDGFCLVASQGEVDPTWKSHCATISEFQASGLDLSGPGFAIFWDGDSISSSH